MREHVGKVIGKFAAPAKIVFSPGLPKDAVGQIMRRCATSQKIDRWVTPPRWPIRR